MISPKLTDHRDPGEFAGDAVSGHLSLESGVRLNPSRAQPYILTLSRRERRSAVYSAVVSG